MIKVTVDTSVIASEDSDILHYLTHAHQDHTLDVGIASRFRMDKEQDSDLDRVKRHKKIAETFSIVPSTFLCGAKYEDHEVGILTDDHLYQQLFCLFDINLDTKGGRHSSYDVDHIYSHLMQRRDFFLTYESKMIRKRCVLKELKLDLSHPDKFLHAVQSLTRSKSLAAFDFREALSALLDQIHLSQPNPKLSERLRRMRLVQHNLEAGILDKEDKKAIRAMVKHHKAYYRLPIDLATELFKDRYIQIKRHHLSMHPSQKITANDMVKAFVESYPRSLRNEV